MSCPHTLGLLMAPDPQAIEHAYNTMVKQQQQQKRKQQQKEDEAIAARRAKAKAKALADDASSFSSVSTIMSLKSALRKSIGGGGGLKESERRK
jgi:hypothetical protein